MKYRAIANGNVLDAVPASLVGVLYEEIPEGVPEEVPPPDRSEETPRPVLVSDHSTYVVKARPRGRPRKVPLPEPTP